MSDSGRLIDGTHVHSLERVDFYIFVREVTLDSTEYFAALYFLLVPTDVDGGDGELCPDMHIDISSSTPFPARFTDAHPYVFSEKNGHQLESWYGNDSPSIENSEVSLEYMLETNEYKIVWRGEYVPFGGSEWTPIEAVFSLQDIPIILDATDSANAMHTVSMALPTLDLDSFEITEIKENYRRKPEEAISYRITIKQKK